MNILQEIIIEKRKEVENISSNSKSNYSPRGFAKSLLMSNAPRIIAEIKRASPSKGLIREDLDPVQTAIAYKNASASCISVLTDEKFFKGNKQFLSQIRALDNAPKILRKDFIIDVRQIKESVEIGADAILLIAAALTKKELETLVLEAKKYKLDILLEVHSKKELEESQFVFDINPNIMLGINNRDLKTFKTDLSTTKEIIDSLNTSKNKIAKTKIIVSESGIFNSKDLAQLSSYGANAFLVGESLVSEGSPEKNLKNLISNFRKDSSFSIDKNGFYGEFGGRYAPEVLMPALVELEEAFEHAQNSEDFLADLKDSYKNFIGRPTPLVFCENLTKKLGGAKIFIKNEGAAHTGAHKINHCVGQALLAKLMGKKKLVAETGAGQHGLASSTVAAKFGLDCIVFMGAKDAARQRPNVFWMEKLGAEVSEVEFGGQRLKDAVNAALKYWITNVRDTHYLLGSALGPHPFPEINRFFQKVIGEEIKEQIVNQVEKLPDYVIACVGGGSNSIGAFNTFLSDSNVELIGIEAGGKGKELGKNAIRLKSGKVGVVEGYKSYWLLDDNGQVADTSSISAGLDYAGIGPIHAYLNDIGRVKYESASDNETLDAVKLLASTEGVLSALESAHALAYAIKLAPSLSEEKVIVVNISGRAEKDIFILADALKDQGFYDFVSNYSKGK